MHATTGPSDTGLLKSQAAQENVSVSIWQVMTSQIEEVLAQWGT